ncbi:hypothetical protein ERC79_03765 [Rhodococcus sp. ABRD24]|uniref:hypothetical protein n=1 Tax=Rhodococcus sp. ABRD24 TaxID=2507582 RepID=UPI00103B120E|nr:hypothetical protein [Rhodococcus sp. ABRD24]QBJ95172.1 hypothetical protein ERC79_03765 [Rhodococcus sp. ABRD24]
MGTTRWAGAVLAGAAILTTTMAAPQAEAHAPQRESATATRAVAALVSDDAHRAAQALPGDFAEVIGYRPQVRDGILVNPHGDCSSPVPLPTEFETACMAHDLGYDLLRYARVSGGDLGTWARTDLDAQLDRRMHAACDVRDTDRASCYMMANAATTAVDANSWRQGYGTPVEEPWLRYGVGGALAFTGIALASAAVRRVRHRLPTVRIRNLGSGAPA